MKRTFAWLLFAAAVCIGVPALSADKKDSAADATKEKPDYSSVTLDEGKLTLSWGTYGRVQFTGDLDGGQGKKLALADHPPRLEENPYLELSFYSDYKLPDIEFGATITLALFNLENMFHYSGDADALKLVPRNLYAEAKNILDSGLFLWVGSRMHRGDDIYLLDYWPLDNLNTLGGALGWEMFDIKAALHVGVNRLNDDYDFQEIIIPGRSYGTEKVTTLDRQRVIMSLKFEQQFKDVWQKLGFKYKVYAEVHYIPSGERRLQDKTIEKLDADNGYALGAQLGAWGFGRNSYVNLFFKYSKNLAAYNELSVPYGLNLDKTTDGAEAITFGFSGNYEYGMFGALYGGYVTRWLSAVPENYDVYDNQQVALAVRPMLFLWKYFRAGVELSYQRKYSPGQADVIGTSSVPQIFKFSLIPALSTGPGSLYRPELRIVYTLSVLNEGARYTYPVGDKRRGDKLQHFIGFGAEWWFNAYGY